MATHVNQITGKTLKDFVALLLVNSLHNIYMVKKFMKDRIIVGINFLNVDLVYFAFKSEFVI